MTAPKTPATLALRAALLVLLGGLGVWGILAGVPFGHLSPAQIDVLGGFRISYGVLVVLRLSRAFPGAPLVAGWQQTVRTRRGFRIWMLIGTCIAAGFATPLALLCHWFLTVRSQRSNRTYSVEDALMRLPGFGLLFMHSHQSLSIDQALGWTFGLTSPGTAGVNFFVWTFGMMMFSTGFEKVWSPAWRRGLGFYHFVSIPFIARPAFRRLRRFRVFCIAAGWAGLLLELGLIFTLPSPPLLPLASLAVIAFGLTLAFGPASFFFVGAPTVWAGAFLFAMQWRQQSSPAVPEDPGPLGWALATLYLAGCLAALHFARIRGGGMAWLMERTTGMRPFILFSEVHFYGLYIYRIVADTPGGSLDTIQSFTENGEPGPMQFFRPVAIYSAFTRVTDYCIARLHDQHDRLAFYGRILADLASIGLERLPPVMRSALTTLRLEVRVYDPPQDYDLETSPWRSGWVSIGRFDLSEGGIRFVQEGSVPWYGKTTRWPVP